MYKLRLFCAAANVKSLCYFALSLLSTYSCFSCLMLPLPPSLLLGGVCAAPRRPGRAAARGKVHFPAVENRLLELNLFLKHFPRSCAFFSTPVPFQGGENAGSIALPRRSLGWVHHRDHPFCTNFVPNADLGKDKIFQVVFPMTISPAMKNCVARSFLLFNAIPWFQLFQDWCPLTPSWDGLRWSLTALSAN